MECYGGHVDIFINSYWNAQKLIKKYSWFQKKYHQIKNKNKYLNIINDGGNQPHCRRL